MWQGANKDTNPNSERSASIAYSKSCWFFLFKLSFPPQKKTFFRARWVTNSVLVSAWLIWNSFWLENDFNCCILLFLSVTFLNNDCFLKYQLFSVSWFYSTWFRIAIQVLRSFPTNWQPRKSWEENIRNFVKLFLDAAF